MYIWEYRYIHIYVYIGLSKSLEFGRKVAVPKGLKERTRKGKMSCRRRKDVYVEKGEGKENPPHAAGCCGAHI